MKKIINIFLIIFSLVFFQNCDEEQFQSTLNYVSFGAETYSTGVDPGGSATFDIKVYASQIAATDLTLNVTVDESTDAPSGSYSLPSTVTIPSGSNEGTLSIDLSDVDLGIGINKLILNFSDVLDGLATGSSTTIEFIQNCTEVTGTLDMSFDSYPEESGWFITDALGGVVASAEAGTYAGKASGSESITLCSGRDYTFTFTDSWGDGMGGSYSLTIGGVVKVSGGNSGDFTEDPSDFDTN